MVEREREEAAGGEVGAGGDNGGREGGKECEGEGTLVEGRRKGEGGWERRGGKAGNGGGKRGSGKGGERPPVYPTPRALRVFPESGSEGSTLVG